MIISSYSPSNTSDESVITNFCDRRSFLVRNIPKHNVLIIGGDMNGQISKDENYRSGVLNRNDEYLTDFPLENSLSSLNTLNFQKGRENYGSEPTQITLKYK